MTYIRFNGKLTFKNQRQPMRDSQSQSDWIVTSKGWRFDVCVVACEPKKHSCWWQTIDYYFMLKIVRRLCYPKHICPWCYFRFFALYVIFKSVWFFFWFVPFILGYFNVTHNVTLTLILKYIFKILCYIKSSEVHCILSHTTNYMYLKY